MPENAPVPAVAVADFEFPWDAEGAPPPVAALAAARATLGDTFEVRSGEDRYLFVFSDAGLRSFYDLPETVASKGLADYKMLLRKLPPELFDGRRTFAHDLFGAQRVETYLDRLDLAVAVEVAAMGDAGTFDAFALARRLGHRLGLACWIGPEAVDGPAFERLVDDLARLDGADAFVHPEAIAAVEAAGHAQERAALSRIEEFVGDVLGAGRRDDFLGQISSRWADVEEPAHSVGVARDVVLLHVATMTNLVAALGWVLVATLLDPEAGAAARSGDRAALDAVALDAIRRSQRSIMMRTALRSFELDDGVRLVPVDRGTIVATMLPLTNGDADHPWVTTFGHGSHRCPAKRFSMSAMARTVTTLHEAFELSAAFGAPPAILEHQIGGVGRAATSAEVGYRLRSR